MSASPRPVPPVCRHRLAPALAAALAAGSALASGSALAQGVDEAGVLDRPVTVGDAPFGTPANPRALEAQVRAEQRRLERLPRGELRRRAERGERGAQVALGTDFAREADLLDFAPAAANDALADAARWYSTAAARGFPGAPSLDQAGVRFWPIRIRRETRP